MKNKKVSYVLIDLEGNNDPYFDTDLKRIAGELKSWLIDEDLADYTDGDLEDRFMIFPTATSLDIEMHLEPSIFINPPKDPMKWSSAQYRSERRKQLGKQI